MYNNHNLYFVDLKPENILLHLDGHIRMADFGLSKQADKPPEMRVTCKKERSLPFFHSVCFIF